MYRRVSLLFFALTSCVAPSALAAADEARGEAFFEKRIRPVLVQHCYKCHSSESDSVKGNLLLDTREGMQVGGDSGPAVVPSDVESSLLLESLRYESFEMPPDGKLPGEVIADFEQWVRMGAPDPRDGNMPVEPSADPSAGGAALWSLEPLADVEPPAVARPDWPRDDLDRFVMSTLDKQQLEPVGDADPTVWLRRVFYDLIGLPPSPEQLRAFLADASPAARERLVDSLLASPQFGERWARHWLDVVRFAESNGKDRDVLMPHAWRYRNYVIDAFNADLPYDRFITEQLAGDLLPADSPAERDRLQVATGLLAIGAKSLTGNLQLDLVDDQIDTVCRAVLGLTAGCARCHDHKFDPIPTRDYYALAGIFRSTETLYGGGLRAPKDPIGRTNVLLVLGDDADGQVARVKARQKRLTVLEKEKKSVDAQLKKLQKQLPKDWETRLVQLQQRDASTGDAANPGENKPADEAADATTEDAATEDAATTDKAQVSASDRRILEFAKQRSRQDAIDDELKELKSRKIELALAVGVRDDDKIIDSPIHIRGERNKTGETVPRGFLSCIDIPDVPSIGDGSSGRRELAAWLTHPQNPLTPRVAVNRIWQHLFGRGLVETVDNFGANAIPPTHPELLDHLARRFVENDWSTRRLVRDIVLSRTYGLANEYSEAAYATDPENKFYWRHSRRRLEAEAIRDAMLAASGDLDPRRPTASPVARIGEGEVGRGINTRPLDEPFPYRSVYLPIIRGLVPEILATFDFPEPSNVQGLRDTTNVPAQSLFLMNHPLVIEQAQSLAERLVAETADDQHRIEQAYFRCLSRAPQADERERLLSYLAAADQRWRKEKPDADPDTRQIEVWTNVCQAMFASAEFRYVD